MIEKRATKHVSQKYKRNKQKNMKEFDIQYTYYCKGSIKQVLPGVPIYCAINLEQEQQM